MSDQQAVDELAREYLRVNGFDDATIETLIYDPMFTGSLAYHRIKATVAMAAFKRALVASLPRWLRKYLEAR